MTAEKRTMICKWVFWIIPSMILTIVGDCCIGIVSTDGRIALVSRGMMSSGGIRAIMK